MATFNENLKFLLKKNGIRQQELGKAVGVSGSQISRYLLEENDPTITIAKKIAEYFNVSLDWLLGNKNIKLDLDPDVEEMIKLYRKIDKEAQKTILDLMKKLKK